MLTYAAGSWLIALASISFSAVLLRKRPLGPVARAYLRWSSCITLWSVGYGITLSGLLAYEPTLAWNRWCQAMAALIAPCFFEFLCLSAGRADLARLLVPVHLAAGLVNAVGLLVLPAYVQGLWSFGVFRYQPLGGPLYGLFAGCFWITTLHAYWIALRSYRIAEGATRQQLKLLLIGTGIAYAGGGSLFLPGFGIPLPSIGVFFVLSYVIMVGYLVLAYRFLDVQLALNRALVYSMLVACITAIYLVPVIMLEHWFQVVIGYRSLLASVVVALLIAVFFNPLRDWIQRLVDRALFHATPAELAAQRERLLAEVRKGDQMKAVATLAAGLAHEIKNPLAAIKTFVAFLPELHQDPAFREKFQRIVTQELEKMQKIAESLLTFAKPADLRREPVALTELISETASLLSGACVARQVRLETRPDPALSVSGDRTQLKQALLNLCLNSLDAMPQGGRLTIHAGVLDGHVRLSVEDTGAGIPPEHLARLGEPFFTTKPTGTGLGLSVVHGIVKEHAGRIEVTSKPGQGTTMTILLPAKDRGEAN